MATIQRFEDLELWQKARKLAKAVYDLTSKEPISKDFRLKDQMRGSSGSIMDNIAEGFERSSRLEFINHLSIAKGEAGELKSQLYRALDVNYIDSSTFNCFYSYVDEITKGTTSFISYLNTTDIKGQKFKNR